MLVRIALRWTLVLVCGMGGVAPVWAGAFNAQTFDLANGMKVVKSEWQRAAKGEVTDGEVAEAKDYLTGALPVSLDGPAAIAAKLLSVQRLGQDVEYITAWDSKIRSVEPDAVRETARRLFRPQALSFAIAGNPEGL